MTKLDEITQREHLDEFALSILRQYLKLGLVAWIITIHPDEPAVSKVASFAPGEDTVTVLGHTIVNIAEGRAVQHLVRGTVQ